MPKYVALRDRRLKGGVPARTNLGIINTDEHTSLRHAFDSIRAMACGVGRITSMFILCHGYAGEDTRGMACADAGGMGLQLGQERVTHRNVNLWRAIRNLVESIVVYSCAAADTQKDNIGSEADGRYLMGALALHTGATVYAADRIQWYGTHNSLEHGRFEWGKWEGNVHMFRPNGAPGLLVWGPPTEFKHVMNGTAP